MPIYVIVTGKFTPAYEGEETVNEGAVSMFVVCEVIADVHPFAVTESETV